MGIQKWQGPTSECPRPYVHISEDDRRDFSTVADDPEILRMLTTWRKRTHRVRRVGVAHGAEWFNDMCNFEIWEFVTIDTLLSHMCTEASESVEHFVINDPLASVSLRWWRECEPEDVMRRALGGLHFEEVVIIARDGDLVEVAVAATERGQDAAWRLEDDTVRALTAADRSVAFDMFTSETITRKYLFGNT